VTVAIIIDKVPGVTSTDDLRDGAVAAAGYINNDLGGLKGHPITPWVCNPAISDVAASGVCAHEAIQKKAVAVIGSNGTLTIAAGALLRAAKIPVIVTASNPAEYTDTGGFADGCECAEKAGGIYLAQKFKPKSVSVLFPDLGALNKSQTTAMAAPFAAAGATINVSLYPFTGADITPAAAKAKSSNPDFMVLAGGAGQSAKLLYGALQNVGFPASKTVSSMSQVDGPTLKLAGSLMDGAYFTFDVLPWTETSEPQVRTFIQKYQQYAPKGGDSTYESGWSEWGFAQMMTVYYGGKALKGAVSGPNLYSYYQTATYIPGFLTHSLGKPVAGYPGVRNAYVRVVQYQGGKLVDVSGKWVTGPLAPANG
jgi:branched-chain amino acid transport system substrate-binding protein